MTSGKPIDDTPQQSTAVSSTAPETYFATRPWLLALVLVVLTFVVYQPTWHAGFVWDDDQLITNNRIIRASDGLYRIWFTTEAPDYYPLTSSFWWLQWRLWGKNPAGWHAVSVLLHAANVVLVWMIFRRLKIPGAWLAALLFAVHPVNVVTVAWISEQKNTLSMLLFAVAILLYLRFDETSDRRWYGLSLAAFLLALFSKAAVVMLPVVLLGCIWWSRGRLGSRDWVRTAPFFALSVLLGLTTVWFQYHRAMSGQEVRVGGVFSRVAVAGLAPWFYLSKAVLPLDLCMVYPQWNPGTWDWSGWLPGIALAGGFALLWWNRDGWGRPLLFGLGYFVVMLFPVLGFFDQGFYHYSLVADHWQYYSLVGVTALASAGTVALGTRLHRERQVINSVAGAVVIVLAAMSWQRCFVFRTEETLFQDNLLHNPLAWVAYDILGNASERAGRIEEAITHFEQALRVKPDYAEAHYHLGNAFLQGGTLSDAIGQYEEALRLRPDFAEAHCSLGIALYQTGKREEAIDHYEQALRVRPDFAEAHHDLGNAFLKEGKLSDAIGQYEEVLRLKPDFAEAHGNLGKALLREGKLSDAIEQYEQALRLEPDDAEAHTDLGVALARTGRIEEAIHHFEQALRLRPDDAEAHTDLGVVLAGMGRIEEATKHLEQALQINPDDAEAHYNLGNVFLQEGKFSDAIVHFEQALRLKPNLAVVHYNLGNALAQAGRVPEAIEHFQQALTLRPDFAPARNALARLQGGQ